MAKRTTAYLFALLIFVVDQLSKWFIIGPMNLEAVQNIQLLPFFDFTWVENRGISLGIAQAQNETHRWILVAVTAAIAVGVAWWIRKEEARGDQLALAMVLGGALGNIRDRYNFGYVIDYADLHFGTFRPFLIFNIADAAITIGVVIILARAFLMRDTVDKAMNERPAAAGEKAP